jgi:hypothetical protein
VSPRFPPHAYPAYHQHCSAQPASTVRELRGERGPILPCPCPAAVLAPLEHLCGARTRKRARVWHAFVASQKNRACAHQARARTRSTRLTAARGTHRAFTLVGAHSRTRSRAMSLCGGRQAGSIFFFGGHQEEIPGVRTYQWSFSRARHLHRARVVSACVHTAACVLRSYILVCVRARCDGVWLGRSRTRTRRAQHWRTR